MKNLKKVLLFTLCAILLVSASVMGTVAYLTSEKEVVNTFTVGDIAIKLYETKVNTDGEALDPSELTEEGNQNIKLVPGRTITKDPTVWVREGSEPAYIRMKVTINKYTELQEIFGNFLPQDYVTGWDNSVWVTTGTIETDNENNCATYEFRYCDSYTAVPDDNDGIEDYDELPALFTSFTLPGADVDNTKLAKLKGLNITVVAEAIQSETFANAEAAWSAFDN